ncbi:peptidase S41 [Candidatus Peregrinibacteria bacterium CG10_big_fil_rev_8_21_14_0_10_49_10]|nr:MAG: peptidase S41 [Candidatus Peregrinibacteria bacterium CG10_big_fil_rev_8_21_14_0_10_49_10]
MPKFLRALTLVLLPVIMLLLGLQLGARLERKKLTDVSEQLALLYAGGVGSGQTLGSLEGDLDFALLDGIWRLLERHYIKPQDLKVQPLLFGAATGMVNAVGDRYTTFMTPQKNSDFQQSLQGKLEGIGAELTMKDSMIVVVAPLKGSPALRAGLEPEDTIVAVDGVDISDEDLAQVVQRIRGKRGTTVVLTVVREEESEPLEISIVRDVITVPSVESKIIKTGSGSVGYISINQFGEATARELESSQRGFLEEDLKGIILDVRFNGGGYLERAVEMVSLFLQQGKVVSVARRGGEPEHHYVNGRPLNTTTPMVVLINEGSASAAEILAGALKDSGRATIVGKTSYGKGTVQEVFELPGGSSVRITIARWLTPNGTDLSMHGIDPDIEVERSKEDMQQDRDPQLDAAVKLLLE